MRRQHGSVTVTEIYKCINVSKTKTIDKLVEHIRSEASLLCSLVECERKNIKRKYAEENVIIGQLSNRVCACATCAIVNDFCSSNTVATQEHS